MAVTTADPIIQLAQAVHLARKYRHHQDCNCCNYRRTLTIGGHTVNADGYCTVDQWRWNEAINRLLTTITHG